MANIKPSSLAEYHGQERAKQQISFSLQAAQLGKVMPHILLDGPPGVGKTTMALLIAQELGTRCKIVDARNIKTINDFLVLVSDLRDNDVLFVDEIHGLDSKLEELLYGMVVDFGYFYNTNDSQQHWIQLHQFVLIGATTKMSEISAPLRTRFGIVANLEYYTDVEMAEIAVLNATKMGLLITEEAALLLAKSARGTARVLNNMLERADDIARVWNVRLVDEELAQNVLNNFGIDERGLNNIDRKFIRAIANDYNNQPVGIVTLSSLLGENEDTLADVVEPYLLRKGLVQKTPRGRILTKRGLEVAA